MFCLDSLVCFLVGWLAGVRVGGGETDGPWVGGTLGEAACFIVFDMLSTNLFREIQWGESLLVICIIANQHSDVPVFLPSLRPKAAEDSL